MSAEQGFAYAQGNLGVCYRDGDGVEKDLALAAEYFKKAAKQGVARAQLDLGDCYYSGTGVEQDYEKATDFYRKAAEQGEAMAQYLLGKCYADGIGVAQNYGMASYWFYQAANHDIAEAQYEFGICCLEGRGVDKDKKLALAWLKKAADNGNDDAKKTIKALILEGNNFGVKNSEIIHRSRNFEDRIADLEKKDIIKRLSLCLLYSERGLCVDGRCNRCECHLGYKPIFNSQGEMIKCVKLAEERTSDILKELEKRYETAKLKQGEIEKIDFSSYKNMSDLFPQYKSQFIENIGYKYIHVANWMNEDTYFYISQGAGVKCVELPKLTGKYITLENKNDIEMLIGSPKILYRVDKYSVGNVYNYGIMYVSEKL